jgi:hypothetical protein
MKKQFLILSILVVVFLIAVPFSIVKAIDNTKNVIVPTEFRNELFSGYYKYRFVPQKISNFHNQYLNHTKDKNEIIFFKAIEFVNKNLLGIIFLIFIIYLLFIYHWPWKIYCNYKTIKLYKRELFDNNKKYSAKRCLEEGKIEKDKNGKEIQKARDHIYLVDYEEKIIHHFADIYTFNKLGYPRPLRDDERCFKISDGYTLGDEIKIYNIVSDIKDILNFKKDF